MGLLQTQKEIATKTGYPLYFCSELPPKTLFKMASIEGNRGILPVYIDIKPNQGVLHIRNGILANFMLTEGFYFIDNASPITYGYGQYNFVLNQDNLRLNNFPLQGEYVFFVNLKPISDIIVAIDTFQYFDVQGSYNVDCKLSFDIAISNPVKLFDVVVKNSDSEHYLTDALFTNISNTLKKHVVQQLDALQKQNVSHGFIKQNKNILLQNFEAKISFLRTIGILVANIEVDELLFKMPQATSIPSTNVPNYNYAQSTPVQNAPSGYSSMDDFNVSEIVPQQNEVIVPAQNNVTPIEGLNLSFEEDRINNLNKPMQDTNTMQQPPTFSYLNDEWLCPSCKNEAHGNVCGFCGYRREIHSQTFIPAPTQQSQWQCINCGMTNTLKFCSNCGSPKPQQVKNACSNCGYRIENPNNPPKFCPECGSKF